MNYIQHLRNTQNQNKLLTTLKYSKLLKMSPKQPMALQ